ncbi:unnamed protein product [Fraxinus pennsylvanica]|uniref:Uncharacterized protein n=1 Tax=Fraxinus pennsylvanica TaxID=56036 RepID=A0AAD1ZTA4_9LAMI|nr:unnamed protein product [Fraxinus pennsylvanica]
MPATDCQEAPSALFSSLGFSILSRRRDKVHSMEFSHEATAQEMELGAFQKLVAENFHELAASASFNPVDSKTFRNVCNAIRDGIEVIRQWQKQLEIVLFALDNQRSIGEGQILRAKKALIDLTIGMLDEKESNMPPARRNSCFRFLAMILYGVANPSSFWIMLMHAQHNSCFLVSRK